MILSEVGELEDAYAHDLDDSRALLKAIRNTERSVQPSRDNKNKIVDEIQRLKVKEPQSTKIIVLEQELVRAEAENLVAEAQLTNIVSFPSCQCFFFFFPLRPIPNDAYISNDAIFICLRPVLSRLVKNFERPTKQNSPPPSSAPRSRSSLPNTAGVFSSSWTTTRSSPATSAPSIPTLNRRVRSSTTRRMICATGGLSRTNLAL